MVLHWFKCVQPKLNALPTQQCTNGNASEALLSPRATTLVWCLLMAIAVALPRKQTVMVRCLQYVWRVLQPP